MWTFFRLLTEVLTVAVNAGTNTMFPQLKGRQWQRIWLVRPTSLTDGSFED